LQAGALAGKRRAEALADVTFYGADGLPVASTFPNWQAGQEQTALQIAPTFYEMVLESPQEQTLFSEVQLYERDFRAAFVPLRIRRDTLGVLGVVLPSNFIVQAASTSRTLFSLLFSVAAGLAVLLGLLVAQRIVRPVMRLLQVSRAITEGDLSQRVGIAPTRTGSWRNRLTQ
jgi:methyl-accepting chemotaxis protein